MRVSLLVSLLAIASCTTSADSASRPQGQDDESARTAPVATEIAWETFEAGSARARRENKPVVLVFTATWCTQCDAYKSVLANPRVIAMSQRFVMIRVDITEQPGINDRYAVDGTYVPRTMFFAPDGRHRAELRSPARSRFSYFLNPHDPSELLGLMQRALEPS